MDDIVRIGIVTARNTTDKTVRVFFPDEEIASDWLKVVQNGTGWMPDIGKAVLCLYLSGFNADGYVLGGTE